MFNFQSNEIFLHKPWRPKGFVEFEIIINVLVSSFPCILIYICYGSTTIINISTLTVRGSTLDNVYRRQILTSEVNPSLYSQIHIKFINQDN